MAVWKKHSRRGSTDRRAGSPEREEERLPRRQCRDASLPVPASRRRAAPPSTPPPAASSPPYRHAAAARRLLPSRTCAGSPHPPETARGGGRRGCSARPRWPRGCLGTAPPRWDSRRSPSTRAAARHAADVGGDDDAAGAGDEAREQALHEGFEDGDVEGLGEGAGQVDVPTALGENQAKCVTRKGATSSWAISPITSTRRAPHCRFHRSARRWILSCSSPVPPTRKLTIGKEASVRFMTVSNKQTPFR